MGDQPGRLTVQELWKLPAKLPAENRNAKPATNKNVTKASDLRIAQIELVKNHHKGPFISTYIYNNQVGDTQNESTVLLTTPDGKEMKCNIHHVNLVSSLDVCVGSQVEIPTNTFPQFWDSIQQNPSSDGSVNSNPQHSYNLQSKTRKW